MKHSRFVVGILLALAMTLLTGFHTTDTVYVVDSSKSNLRWTGYYLFSFAEHFGSIALKQGEMLATGTELTGGSFEIDMTSITDLDMKDGGEKDLTQHLKDTDFFDVIKYPTAKFDIRQCKKLKDVSAGGPNYEILGALTIKAVTKDITISALVDFSNKGLSVKAKFKFDRTQWGVHYNSGKIFSDVGDGAISDAIAIELDLIALPK